jgi:hypothetical protein
MWRVNVEGGKPPAQWEVEHFADVSATEEFVQQLMLEMSEILGGTTFSEAEKENVKHAIMTISTEGLLPAFEHLKRIRSSVAQQLPVLNRRQHYEDFSRVLWHSYKDLTQTAVSVMGKKVGFIWEDNPKFEAGLRVFMEAHPGVPRGFDDFLRNQRKSWQNELCDFRNLFLEHRKEGPERFADFYEPDNAEALFDPVWRTIAEILVVLLAMRLPPGVWLGEVPVAQRTEQNPRRFRWVIPALHQLK